MAHEEEEFIVELKDDIRDVVNLWLEGARAHYRERGWLFWSSAEKQQGHRIFAAVAIFFLILELQATISLFSFPFNQLIN